ncbi:MAG: thermostable hemolysin [Novosphingobium sp.]|jgi:hypothetical protein|nr:thermostable hemolysin [Novosphingobium sp.]
MPQGVEQFFLCERYSTAFGADIVPGFETFLSSQAEKRPVAALGYRRAGPVPLFLEAYLDAPAERLASAALGRSVLRSQIIEIGNFAAVNGHTMIRLWGAAANDLAGAGEVAIATLTRPLRHMFARIGVPIIELAPAHRERLGSSAGIWGCYYELDPCVCVGIIADGQRAINAFLTRRHRSEAA